MMVGCLRRFLVVEDEYLIALDAGGLLSEIFPCDVEICTKTEFPTIVGDGPWDVVLIDVAGSEADAARINLALAQGSAVVLLSAYNHLENGLKGFEDWPVVMKPFSTDTLSKAMIRALSQVGEA